VVEACRQTHSGYSCDFVVVNPDASARFLSAARKIGGTDGWGDGDLNALLMNARERGRLSHLPTTRSFSLPKEIRP
jgi:hypothetical protein